LRTNIEVFFKMLKYLRPYTKGEIHETLQICKSLTKRQIQCFNNVSCHGFEFATPYRALPSFVNDPLSRYLKLRTYQYKYQRQRTV
jgi:hypothetical protein